MIYICRYDMMIPLEDLCNRRRNFPFSIRISEVSEKIREKTRKRILAWMLLEYALMQEYGLSLDQMIIERGKYGKPYFVNQPHIHFSISHCEAGCACILDAKPCGIDLEQRFPWRETLARKICHAQEWDYLMQLSEERREEQLQIWWSEKESYVKYLGRGIGYGLSKISCPELEKEGFLWHRTEKEYILAVYAVNNEKNVIVVTEEELTQ